MTDRRGAAVLEADAVLHQQAWRCPRAGGSVSPEALDNAHRAALASVCRLTKSSPDDVRTCPGHYARTPDAHEAVKLLRWLKAGALHLRVPHPSGAVIDALDELQSALGAREANDLERLRRKNRGGNGNQ